jgi:hypothetical protein
VSTHCCSFSRRTSFQHGHLLLVGSASSLILHQFLARCQPHGRLGMLPAVPSQISYLTF